MMSAAAQRPTSVSAVGSLRPGKSNPSEAAAQAPAAR